MFSRQQSLDEFAEMADADATDTCAPVAALPPDLICCALEELGPNEMVLKGRQVSKGAWSRLSHLHHRTARLGLPLPPQALDPAWQLTLLQTLRTLSFGGKLDVLCAAAASGSMINMELTWGLLQPYFADRYPYMYDDIAPAAVRNGHLHLLPWMLQHGCPVSGQETLEATAEHCDLAGLQRVWSLLGSTSSPPYANWPSPTFGIVRAAGGSAVGPLAKLAWLLLAVGDDRLQHEQQVLLLAAAEGAASRGNMPALRLLQALGMDLPCVVVDEHLDPAPVAPWCSVLAAALQHGHVVVADWLVDEAGCPLLELQLGDGVEQAWGAAARSEGVEAVRWLLRRGVPVSGEAIEAAAGAGRLETVRFLHEACALEVTIMVFAAAARSRSRPTATWLLQAGCPVPPNACAYAAGAGDVDMVLWLVREVGCHWGEDVFVMVMGAWPWRGPESRGGLLQVVRRLVEAGCPADTWGGTLGAAARHGHLPLLRYLHEECGVGFGPGTLAAAAESGSEVVVEWLVGKGCGPGPGGGGI